MKKWQKWSLGIIGAVILFILVSGMILWPTISILIGAGGLEGEKDNIPDIDAEKLKPITKGDADWVSWLGNNGDSKSGVSEIKKDWSKGLEKLWEINYLCQGQDSASWSAPVIQGNRLIVCGRNNDSDLVFCLDPLTGDLLWQTSYKAEAAKAHGSGPRATAAIDEDRVYTFGRSGDLACWNLYDGKKVWHRNITEEGAEEPKWGHSSSPLVFNGKVIVQGGGKIRIAAYDKMSGKLVWKSGEGKAGYAAIVIINIDEKPMILAFHGKGLAALDLENGNEFWNTQWETDYDVNATTPAVSGDKVFISSGYGTGCELLKVSRLKAEVLWKNNVIEAHHSDPYIIDEHIYGYSGQSFQNRGFFKCADLKDGSQKWSTNEMGWGTSLFVDGHILCCDIKGNIFLMKPDSDKFLKVTRMAKALGKVKGPVWTMPVVANGLLYLRFKQRLVCYNIMEEK